METKTKIKTKTISIMNVDIETHHIKKWCVEQAIRISRYNDDGHLEQVDTMEEAKKIYYWVTK